MLLVPREVIEKTYAVRNAAVKSAKTEIRINKHLLRKKTPLSPGHYQYTS